MKPYLGIGLITLSCFFSACQPVRPLSELTPSPANTTVISGTTTTTENITEIITDTNTVTATEITTETGSAPITATQASGTSGGTSGARTPRTTASEVVTATAATSCPALTGDELELELLAKWEEGEERVYMMRKERSESVAGQESVSLDASTPFTISVASVGNDSYTLEWQFGKTELGEAPGLPDPFAEAMTSPPPLTLNYDTDDTGAFLEVTNQEELQTELSAIFDKLLDELFASGEFPEEIMEGARQRIEGLLSDPANFDLLFAQDVQLFHTLYGYYFDSVEPITLPDVRPNLLGGSPIPSELTITPTHYDADQGCLIVTMESIADPVATRNSILEALQEQARQMGVPAPSEADFPPELDLVDTIRFEMDLESGWPLAIYLERVISIGNQSRVESTEILFNGEPEQ